MQRSTFDRSHKRLTSFNVGDVIPFYIDEVLPGDTFDVSTSKVVRMPALITPIMDDIFLDTYYFFVPNRLVWDHWRELMGENRNSAWIPKVEYTVPQLTSPAGGWNVGTIADYMGIPTGVSNLSVSALPFRAYALIMDEWFRDENLTDPLNIPTDDATVAGVNSGDYLTDCAKGGKPFVAAKYHDYFTSCLPAPQKGPDVTIPVSSGANLPVYSLSDQVNPKGNTAPLNFISLVDGATSPYSYFSIYDRQNGTGDIFNDASFNSQLGNSATGNTHKAYPAPVNLWAVNDGSVSAATINQLRMAFQLQKLYEKDARGGTRYIEILKSHFGVTSPDARLQRPEYLGGNRIPVNVSQIVQQSGTVDGSTPQGTVVNQLRMAFQLQKLYEKDARGGTRYIEILKSHFGVTSPDARLQRPEYLGGNRIPVNVSQIVQQSGTVDGSTPQGTVVGMSLTTDSDASFRKSFVEHGFVIGVMVARYPHTYQQGLDRMWSRKDRFDFYWPVLANIGEQPVKNKEIFAQGTSVDDEVFGYQEAWADYRYKPNSVTGEMRSQFAQSLDVWHLADNYTQLPTLSDSWIREDNATVDRVLSVTSANTHQFFCDIYIKNKCTRPMPMYSVPGLIDHH
nr:major head protein [Microvirus sp.]